MLYLYVKCNRNFTITLNREKVYDNGDECVSINRKAVLDG